MTTAKHKKWGWYVAGALLSAFSLWCVNFILFLAMESARTYADLPAIEQRYHITLALLLSSVVGAVVCFIVGRRVRNQAKAVPK
jgi:NO-binding membrane sensor protein with MHYT domain